MKTTKFKIQNYNNFIWANWYMMNQNQHVVSTVSYIFCWYIKRTLCQFMLWCTALIPLVCPSLFLQSSASWYKKPGWCSGCTPLFAGHCGMFRVFATYNSQGCIQRGGVGWHQPLLKCDWWLNSYDVYTYITDIMECFIHITLKLTTLDFFLKKLCWFEYLIWFEWVGKPL